MKNFYTPRILLGIIGLLIITNAVSVWWIVSDIRNHSARTYPLIDVARNFVRQENFIVNIQPLREALREFVSTQPYTLTVYIEFLNTGANISINSGADIWPASLAKLPLALAAVKKIERGEWTWENELVLFDEDKEYRSGVLFMQPTGTRFTLRELLTALLRDSDNTAYRMLLRNMGARDLEPIVEEVGLEELFKPDGKVDAKEYSRIFRTLYTSSFLTRENSSFVLETLSETSFDEFFSSGIPSEVRVAHKWGINDDVYVYADSGIVYLPDRPYLITVMVQGTGAPGEREAVGAVMKVFGEKTYAYFNSF